MFTGKLPVAAFPGEKPFENIDFDTKMNGLQAELKELLIEEEKSKADLLEVFKELGYEIEL